MGTYPPPISAGSHIGNATRDKKGAFGSQELASRLPQLVVRAPLVGILCRRVEQTAFRLLLRKGRSLLNDVHGAVVVAMRAMRKVQVAVDEIIDVVPVRNGFMAAAGPVTMTKAMSLTSMSRRAGGRVCRADGKDMLIHMVFMEVMKVPVVQVILMVLVVDGTVAAKRPVSVHMGVMNLMGGHARLLGLKSCVQFKTVKAENQPADLPSVVVPITK